eukprot:CAMPEP_0194681170 /NCGR_PEP_ID=MMETSP0295-20121207/11930_1 /TAXON_ID=39354 /ORGANISM="Heterosigma akashiwo, Strain CCMP2393" /LENGTH=93 /DNA_ID=CAMNT_0039567117 /DNA_START=243 /DNA_END=522 /DNA_ORIENTATION=+
MVEEAVFQVAGRFSDELAPTAPVDPSGIVAEWACEFFSATLLSSSGALRKPPPAPHSSAERPAPLSRARGGPCPSAGAPGPRRTGWPPGRAAA